MSLRGYRLVLDSAIWTLFWAVHVLGLLAIAFVLYLAWRYGGRK